MTSYEDDLNRFLDDLRTIAADRDATRRSQEATCRKLVDDAVRTLGATSHFRELFGTDEALRGWVIEQLKERRKIPLDFRYGSS